MTETLRAKITIAIWSLQESENTLYEHVKGDKFHHYGNDYRIEKSSSGRFLIYRKNSRSSHEDLIAKAIVNDNGGVTVLEVKKYAVNKMQYIDTDIAYEIYKRSVRL